MTPRKEPALPDAVKVGPLTYDVTDAAEAHRRSEHDLMDSIFGSCDLKKQVIVINPEAAGGRARVTLVHEVLHAVIHVSGIKIGESKEERLVRALEGPILSVLRDNPDLVAYLTGGET